LWQWHDEENTTPIRQAIADRFEGQGLGFAKRERRTERFFCWREITNGTTACLDTAVDCLDDSSSR